MKKTNSLIWSVLFAFVSMFIVGCSNENENNESDITPVTGNIAGTYDSDVTLDAGTAYSLDGAMVMTDGTTLTIPAGTKIIAAGGTTSYIAISQGAKIDVQGTSTSPVIMTADSESHGQWGGLVVCGNAPINTGDGSLSEVGNLPYGGSDSEDNSGSIEYLRVEYTGYQYNSEKQFNGVSFFGVGSGTTVSYVSSYMGNDDGIEFFGGTVNADHLVSIDSQDDGIDFADGWSGSGRYWYAIDSKKSGIEGSNNGSDGAATPMTTASLSNITIVGMGEKPWYLKEGAGSQTIDNVVLAGLSNLEKAPYFYADDNIDASNIIITNAKFIGVSESDKFDDGITGTENNDATGAGNGIGLPDWALDWAYDADWSSSTVIEAGNIAGTYDGNVLLDPSQTYTLDGSCVVEEGGSLTIPSGTTITATAGTTSYIAISQGAKIYVTGTADAPVVMTASSADYGQWGGLVVCGLAPINTGDGSLSEVGNLPYGGDVSEDNSGSIEYLRLEYTGYQYNSEKQFNGVSFFGVGSGTTVSYVSSYMGNDDGIEFFGGAVNANHLVSIDSQDDGIDFADGWSGIGEYWYSKDSQKSGIEGSNNGSDGAATPMTDAKISNVTIIGMGEKPWYLKEGGGKQTIDNVVIGGLTNTEKGPYFYADDNVDASLVSVTNVYFIDSNVEQFDDGLSGTVNSAATGAGNSADEPTWASGWATPSE